MDIIKDIFKKYQKQIITLIVILVIVVLVNRHGWRILKLFNPAAKKTSPYLSATGELPEERKLFVQGIARELYDDIYSTPWTGHNYEPYTESNTLYDDEIQYLADYYKQHVSQGNSLYEDIETQWYTWGSSASKLQSKLSGLNKR